MNQTQSIKRHLKSGKSITAIQALRQYECFRLAARINDLRNQGMPIVTRIFKRNGKRYASYSLVQKTPLGGLRG